MAERKVIGFPSRHVDFPPVVAGADQLCLFGPAGEGRGKVAFLDVADLAEETLLRTLAMNAVTAVVDLRPVPVFARPKFRHRHVIFYLHSRRIEYIEYAFIGVRSIGAGPEISAMNASGVYDRIEPALDRGLSLCLYDQRTRELGWLDDVRRAFRHARGYMAELHPRWLSGTGA